jgi:hypothetical protein
MAGPGCYKIAFWSLLFAIAVVQIVITVVTHEQHVDNDARHSLLPNRRGLLPTLIKRLPAETKHSPSYHSDSISKLDTSGPGPARKKVWQEVLSSSPKIVLVHNFATFEE